MSEIKTLNELFNNVDILKVPSYQRAYSWEEEQLNQFVADMLEMKGKGGYYYGHFILEETDERTFEIIDGQQRITTFILFLMVCQYFNKVGYDNFINKFETVAYDQDTFEAVKSQLKSTIDEWDIENLEFATERTLSLQRILFALKHFKDFFINGKLNLKLELAEIDDYIKILSEAHISTHRTNSKAVAVQIFELQNTRGIKLNLIEKVKSKLMKAVYLNAESEKAETIISDIQKNFSEIYRSEESASLSAFVGELTLEDILFSHLTVVDDGTKLSANSKNIFNSPSKWGNREEVILNYFNSIIENGTADEIVNYVILFVQKFRLSVGFVSKKLPMLDLENHIIGDALILDKQLSLEFFIILFHVHGDTFFKRADILELWERFLFIRDFHDRYYQMKYRDDFAELLYLIAKNLENVEVILNRYLINGFRPDLMEEQNLALTVTNYVKNNESNILRNAFHWWSGKMVYALYKFEIKQGADLKKLRKIIKGGRSV
jgi:hypothetical protein